MIRISLTVIGLFGREKSLAFYPGKVYNVPNPNAARYFTMTLSHARRFAAAYGWIRFTGFGFFGAPSRAV